MNSLIDIQSQIEKLQKQAADIKSREFDKTVLDIRAKMQAFGITIKDLQSAAPKGQVPWSEWRILEWKRPETPLAGCPAG